MIVLVRRLVCVSLFLFVNLCYAGLVSAGIVTTAISITYGLLAAAWIVHISRSYHAPRRRAPLQ